ncbi:hypothetical protein BDV98DRAFT_574769 [Pterulicium gracile]|uniref:Uncharacterized protein n=1 Tax=Pterulicium gracile TaxID=1884261 RepID=A0A5C3QFU4_9AGAR|nr:hypothetical protein BDV98DRAFT_574769 [Pterula gracilis]
MGSTATDTLEVHAHIPPICLIHRRICLRIVPACHHDRHKTRTHLTPLDNLIAASPIPIPRVETIRPVHYAPNTTHLFTVSIPRSRDASEKADQDDSTRTKERLQSSRRAGR